VREFGGANLLYADELDVILRSTSLVQRWRGTFEPVSDASDFLRRQARRLADFLDPDHVAGNGPEVAVSRWTDGGLTCPPPTMQLPPTDPQPSADPAEVCHQYTPPK